MASDEERPCGLGGASSALDLVARSPGGGGACGAAYQGRRRRGAIQYVIILYHLLVRDQRPGLWLAQGAQQAVRSGCQDVLAQGSWVQGLQARPG